MYVCDTETYASIHSHDSVTNLPPKHDEAQLEIFNPFGTRLFLAALAAQYKGSRDAAGCKALDMAHIWIHLAAWGDLMKFRGHWPPKQSWHVVAMGTNQG